MFFFVRKLWQRGVTLWVKGPFGIQIDNYFSNTCRVWWKYSDISVHHCSLL